MALRPLSTQPFDRPVFLTTAPGYPEEVFILEQTGRILRIRSGQASAILFLDISEHVASGREQGLLGLAFHPRFADNGRFFVNYTRASDDATVIAEYRTLPATLTVNPRETVLLVIPQPYKNHNGGMLAFSPDHLLYIGMGDGGSGGDPHNFAQDPHKLLGKILRIDIDQSTPYAIPPDNPFLDGTGRPEVYAWGLRNPWRFSFDRHTGELWAADVGQNAWEEINRIAKGHNYGWRIMEGDHCYLPAAACSAATNLIPPVTAYAHTQGRCSVTGGYVYRGSAIPDLIGTYVFADFCTGEIWGFRSGYTRLLLETHARISSFGEDATGEIYVVIHEGGIFHLIQRMGDPGG